MLFLTFLFLLLSLLGARGGVVFKAKR